MIQMTRDIDFSLPYSSTNKVLFKLNIGNIKNGERMVGFEGCLTLTIESVDLTKDLIRLLAAASNLELPTVEWAGLDYLIERVQRKYDYAVIENSFSRSITGSDSKGLGIRRNKQVSGNREYTLKEWTACFLRGQGAYPEYEREFLSSPCPPHF
ncbi:hypothetical protein Peetri_00205 [Pseudomonas phage vB_PpuM-Peetri]